jgi:hypothetical protein
MSKQDACFQAGLFVRTSALASVYAERRKRIIVSFQELRLQHTNNFYQERSTTLAALRVCTLEGYCSSQNQLCACASAPRCAMTARADQSGQHLTCAASARAGFEECATAAGLLLVGRCVGVFDGLSQRSIRAAEIIRVGATFRSRNSHADRGHP